MSTGDKEVTALPRVWFVMVAGVNHKGRTCAFTKK